MRSRRSCARAPPSSFWGSQTVSLAGDQITLLALPLVGVLALHAGAGRMGLLTAAAWAPSLVLSLHAGAWVDRTGRVRETGGCGASRCARARATPPAASSPAHASSPARRSCARS